MASFIRNVNHTVLDRDLGAQYRGHQIQETQEDHQRPDAIDVVSLVYQYVALFFSRDMELIRSRVVFLWR
jgi:hypothetical protein